MKGLCEVGEVEEEEEEEEGNVLLKVYLMPRKRLKTQPTFFGGQCVVCAINISYVEHSTW